MSYILDALNKSEQERQQRDHGVSLQPLTGVPHADRSGSRWMPVAAAAIVLAAAGIFIGVYFAIKSPATTVQGSPGAIPLPQSSRPTPAAVEPPPRAAQPATVAPAPVANRSVAPSVVPSAAPSLVPSAVEMPAAPRAGASDSVKSLYQRKGMPAEQAMAQSAAEAAQAKVAAPIDGRPVAGDTVTGTNAVKTFASDDAATVQTQDAAQQTAPVQQKPAVPKSTVNHKALNAEIARQREAELAARVQAELEEMQAQDAALAAKRAQSQPASPRQAAPKPEPATAAPPTDLYADVPLATQLANDVQKRIPNIDFGAHVYAGNTNAGFVILNGKKHYAGDTVAPGLKVERITESGVILDLNGTRFRLNSMSSWIN